MKKNFKKKFFFRKFITYFYKFSDLVITFSNENKKFLKNNVKVNNVEVIYNHFIQHGGEKKIKKIYNVFFIGRLTEDKDPEFFLNNCIELSKKINFNINIVGKGERLRNLKYLAKGYKNIKIYGYIEKGIHKLNKEIDIFCVTSKYDGTPNVLGEAMSYKIPCLAPRNIGLSNLLLANGKYGYLYKPNSHKDFKKKLYEILIKYNAARLKANKGFNSLKRFNQKNTLNKLEKIILKSL